jgi:exodeoxyribonuclease VII small subunit
VNEPAALKLTFEQALADLEKTVRALEDGQTGLEEALAHYEEGVGLLKHCYRLLREAEQRIVLLTGEDADGKPLTQPFEHSATLSKMDSTRR